MIAHTRNMTVEAVIMHGDTRHDMVVKPELLKAYMKENYKKPPFAVFEDRDSMVAKWRELGYTCFQPAEGDF